jgi:hypothetical protein
MTGQVFTPWPSLPLRMMDGHLLAQIDREDYLVDTGSPVTIRFSDNADLEGMFGDLVTRQSVEHTVLDAVTQAVRESVWNHVSPQVAGLIGMDFLGQFDCLFAMEEGILCLSADMEMPDRMTRLSLTDLGGSPVLSPVQVGGESFEMLWDTGATISYFQSASAIESGTSLGRRWDFHPFSTPQRFEVEISRVPVQLGEAFQEMDLISAVLPEFVVSGGVNILGSEVLKTSDVYLSMKRGAFGLRLR